ncbi:CDP-diacylglycerol--serine O-phosphatidyltransferase [Neisseria sp. P0014.S009]|uniref:CDP-diacylglycerol--serine O-phosphatidyltransferase n=1 Tax=unclassified Neisseria TaxID=2623750 RepID=UPI003F81165D
MKTLALTILFAVGAFFGFAALYLGLDLLAHIRDMKLLELFAFMAVSGYLIKSVLHRF